MDLVLPQLNMMLAKDNVTGMAPAPEPAACPPEAFTCVLKNAKGDDPGAAESGMSTHNIAAVPEPNQSSEVDRASAEVPQGLLQQVSALLRLVLAKTTPADTSKLLLLDGTKTSLPPQTNVEGESTECEEGAQHGALSLIEQIVAAVLTALQVRAQTFANPPTEQLNDGSSTTRTPADRLTELVTALVRRVVDNAQKLDLQPSSSAMDSVRAADSPLQESVPVPLGEDSQLPSSPTPLLGDSSQAEGGQSPGTEPVKQLVAALVECVKTVLKGTEQQNSVQTHVDTSPTTSGEHPSAGAPPPYGVAASISTSDISAEGRLSRAMDDLLAMAETREGINQAPSQSARDEAAEHRREDRPSEHPQPSHGESREAEAFVRFEMKESDAAPTRSDRSLSAPVRQSALQDWREYEAGPSHPSVNLEVTPSELGRVRLHVALAGDRIYANVITEHAGMRDFLLAEQPRLQEGLSAQGLEIGGFQVAVEQQEHGGREYRGLNINQNQSARPRVTEAEVAGWPDPSHQGLDWERQALSLFV